MEVSSITLITATTALVSAVVGPLVSFVVSARQIRATVISNNRERWIEAMRDTIAEYVGLILTAAVIRGGTTKDSATAIADDHDLRQIVERVIFNKNKLLLMLNPEEARNAQLCEIVEKAYRSLTSDSAPTIVEMRSDAESVTRAGREVLRAEWSRVKRGQ